MEKFSFLITKEIVEKIQPQRILIVGMQTYDKLKDFLELKKEDIVLRRNRKNHPRMIVSADYAGHAVFAVIHLSGGWSQPNEEEMDALKKWFKKEFGSKGKRKCVI